MQAYISDWLDGGGGVEVAEGQEFIRYYSRDETHPCGCIVFVCWDLPRGVALEDYLHDLDDADATALRFESAWDESRPTDMTVIRPAHAVEVGPGWPAITSELTGTVTADQARLGRGGTVVVKRVFFVYDDHLIDVYLYMVPGERFEEYRADLELTLDTLRPI